MSTIKEWASIKVYNHFLDDYVSADGEFEVRYVGERPVEANLVDASTEAGVPIFDIISEADRENIEIQYIKDLVGC